MAAWTSPERVVGLPQTPPRRTSWAPTSPSPLRKSFTLHSAAQNEEAEDDDEELLLLKLAEIQTQLALKKAEKKRKLHGQTPTSTLQVPQSPPQVPPPAHAPTPTSPQRVLLGIDRGKKASEVSLKNPWKAPTLTPEKPKQSFADRFVTAVRENKRKAEINEERERKKAKTFSATAIATALTNRNANELSGDDEWCKYTGFNLRMRVLPQAMLKEEFRGKTTYSVSDLYRLVTPPNYDPPQYDTLDFLVTGIVASKSPVRHVKGREDGGNYLVLKLTDLKVITFKMGLMQMDIDLFLFGSAFTDTWKAQRGMVVVLLNPGIMKRRDGKGFNLRMTENHTPLGGKQKPSEIGGESFLEVGLSKDLGGCEALKADGTPCGDWVDTRHTRICAYHVDQGLKRARKGRMEYAVGMRAFSPKKEKERRDPFAPKRLNAKDDNPKSKKTKPYEPDRWDGGGGVIYHSQGPIPETEATISSKKRIEGIKRELKGSERDRELRKIFKSFAPPKPVPKPPVEEVVIPSQELTESKAFDAKRIRWIGFDPRRRPNEPQLSDKKVAPIVGSSRISLDGVLNGECKSTHEETDSDSDSDLDIIMEKA